MSHLLPNIPKHEWIKRKAVMTSSGLSSRSVSERFKFERCTSDENDILDDANINTIFIATRHNSHASYVVKALRRRLNVFVEKPLCLTEAELDDIVSIVERGGSGHLMVGFNRRFSPLTTILRQQLSPGPMSMVYRINAGSLPGDTWIHDREVGGGRIIGEVCHFIDFLTYLNGSLPRDVQAFGLPDPFGHEDTVTVNLRFANGSIGSISYFANGSKNLPKEYLEIYQTGTTAILRDFKEVETLNGTRTTRKKLMFQDKGQAVMVRKFLETARSGGAALIPFKELSAVTRATIRTVEALRSGSTLPV